MKNGEVSLEFIDNTVNKSYFDERAQQQYLAEVDSREKLLLSKMRIVIEVFLASPCSMEKLSERTGIARATVSRYLNDDGRLQLHFKEEYLKIKSILNKQLTPAERDIRLGIIVRHYIEFGGSIEELSSKLGFSTSTIQRDLNDEERIIRLFDADINNIIKGKLIEASIDARSSGGRTFCQNNEALKDENGKFVGSVKKR